MLRNKNIRLHLLAAGVLCVVAYLSWSILAPDDKNESSRENLPGSISLRVKDVHYSEVDDAGITWEIAADTATLMKQEKISYFENVRVNLTAVDGSVYRLTAHKGSLRTDTKDIQMEGNVVITSNQGARFTTDHLEYSHAQRNVHTDGIVTVETPMLTASGAGMSLDLNARKLTLFSKIRAEIRPFSADGRST